MRAIAHRLLHRGMGNALNRWVEMTEERQRADRLLRRAAARIANRIVVKIFRAWASVGGDAVRRREELVRAAANRLRNRGLAMTYCAWRDLVASMGEERDRKRRASLSRVARRTEVLVLQEWRRYTQEARAALAKAAGRWAQQGQCHAFERLVEYAAMRRRVRRLASRLLNRLCLEVFHAWATTAHEARRQRDVLTRRSLAFLSGKMEIMLCMLLRAWRAEVETTQSRRHELAAKFHGRYLNQVLAKCFLPWAAMALASREHRERVVQRSVARMRFGHLFLIFDEWRRLAAAARAPPPAEDDVRDEAADATTEALAAEVGELRRQLALTRKELKEVSVGACRRYELAVVRAELLARGGPRATFPPPTLPRLVTTPPTDGSLHAAELLQSGESLFEAMNGGGGGGDGDGEGAHDKQPSAFVLQLRSHAPLTFPSPKAPERAAGWPASPRAARHLTTEVVEHVQQNLERHAARLGLATTQAGWPL